MIIHSPAVWRTLLIVADQWEVCDEQCAFSVLHRLFGSGALRSSGEVT